MKNTFFLISFLLFTFFSVAQNNNFDKRLLSKFSEDELNQMQRKSPNTYAYWNFYAANAFQIMDLPNEKTNAHEIKGTVRIDDINDVNILALHYVPLPKDYQYYRIEDTKKLLVINFQNQ
jgi:hypothetical protein